VRIARVLQIQPDRQPCFSLENLMDLTREVGGFGIDVDIIAPADFLNKFISRPKFLRKTYNVIFVGGCHCACAHLGSMSVDFVNQPLVEYHRSGGSVVLFHDIARNGSSPSTPWDYFPQAVGPMKRLTPEIA
jgi:hypothetical protein